ncbi:MAG: two-component sensor histidine kinase, partial [Pseudomonadota bacterium]
MTSVRLRLLILALLPLVVLMPLLLWLAVNRWAANYDNLLIANVESDLRIAEQYLERILTTTGNDVEALARSSRFAHASGLTNDQFATFLARERDALALDFLYYMPFGPAQKAGENWPVIAAAVRGGGATEIDIFSAEDLHAVDPALEQRARLPLIETEAAVPSDRTVEDRGMVVHTATDVPVPGRLGVLVGGILLNRNLDFIDTINALVYQAEGQRSAERQGTATLFLEDVRVSTNVRLFEGAR